MDAMRYLKKLLCLLLVAAALLSLFTGTALAEETEEESRKPKGLIQQLLQMNSGVGYEHYPNVPQYFQQDYSDVPYGGGANTVATHGCGITTLAMLATYLTDTYMGPEIMAGIFQSYSSVEGTSWALFDDAGEKLGFWFIKRTSSWKEVEEAMNNGQVCISLQFASNFTTTAHFIVLERFTDDGKVIVKDANVFNHTRRFAGTDLYETGFTPEFIMAYNKLYWIYEKKPLTVPACSTCGDPQADEFLQSFLLGEFNCAKCTARTNLQAAYWNACHTDHGARVAAIVN